MCVCVWSSISSEFLIVHCSHTVISAMITDFGSFQNASLFTVREIAHMAWRGEIRSEREREREREERIKMILCGWLGYIQPTCSSVSKQQIGGHTTATCMHSLEPPPAVHHMHAHTCMENAETSLHYIHACFFAMISAHPSVNEQMTPYNMCTHSCTKLRIHTYIC